VECHFGFDTIKRKSPCFVEDSKNRIKNNQKQSIAIKTIKRNQTQPPSFVLLAHWQIRALTCLPVYLSVFRLHSFDEQNNREYPGSVTLNPLHPTAYPDVNTLVDMLVSGVQTILGEHAVGMYLEGSLATGNFDQDSDIDFIAVTDERISDETFCALKTMHAEISAGASRWANQLEGSYIPRDALRRYDPQHSRHPNIQRGSHSVLQVEQHDNSGVIHRHILREYGITLFGPDPRTLVDPVSGDDLRRAAKAILADLGARLISEGTPFPNRGYQSFVVLTICRLLYTLEHGVVASKRVAARWMQDKDARWSGLIERAWVGRANPSGPPDLADVKGTLELVRDSIASADSKPRE
jgi:hypothetical protein